MTKKDIINKLAAYCDNPDDDVLRFKEKIKQRLINCPELLYLLSNGKYDNELFNSDDTLNTEGDWGKLFGDTGYIKPYLFFPDVITKAETYLTYEVQATEIARSNKLMYYYKIMFTIITHGEVVLESATGIPRHDLIGSIIREQFNWTNVFGTQIHLISNKEYVSDKLFLAREMIFEGTKLNNLVQTDENGIARMINSSIRR